jgi:hypothetical protein
MGSQEDKDMDKGQMWSVDVIIGIIIFIGVLAVFYGTLSGSNEGAERAAQDNANVILQKLKNNPQLDVITDDNELNMTRLEEISKWNYSDLKQTLGVQSDFCIYVQDQEGRVIPLGNTTEQKYSFGKPGGSTINVSGKRCNENI